MIGKYGFANKFVSVLSIAALLLMSGFFVPRASAAESTVTTPEELTAAISTATAGDVILVDGVLGNSTDGFTLYEVTTPITIRGLSGNKVYGTFNLKADGITLDSLNIYSRGGGSDSLKNAVNVVSKSVNITNSVFEMPNPATVAASGGVGNGIVVWPFGSAAANLNIAGNTFIGYNAAVPGWSSTGLLIAEEIVMSRVGMSDQTSTNISLANEYELATGNTFVNNSYDYVHQNWHNFVGPSEWLYSRVSNSGGLADALDLSAAGSTILLGSGTYTEAGQIVIDKNLTIIGAGKTATIIKPSTDTVGNNVDSAAWFLVNEGVEFNLSNVTLDGDSPNRATNWGIASYGTGTIDNNIIKNIKGGTYLGRGIVVFGNMTISNNTFQNIERIGVHVRGAYSGPAVGSAIVSGNTYEGKGDGDFLDYGIEVGAGASATITGNTLSNARGVASVDDSTSAGILVTDYYGTGTTATITNNNFSNNYSGVSVGYLEDDGSEVIVNANSFFGNNFGVKSTGPTVDADRNWWGTPNPVFDVLVSGAVTHNDWYINPGKTILHSQLDTQSGSIDGDSNDIDLGSDVAGQAELPGDITEIVLSDTTVMNLSNALADLPAPETISVGGDDIVVEQEVLLQSGTEDEPIVITNTNLGNVRVSIPDATTIQGPAAWDGTIMPPKTASDSGNAPSGFQVGDRVIEVGSPLGTLVFDKAVTILLENVTGTVGYKPAGSDNWVKINNVCAGTYGNPTDPAANSECYISDGTNTKIVTFHFTSFGSSQIAGTSGGGGGGGGGGGSPAPAPVTTPAPTTPVESPVTPTTPQGKVLGEKIWANGTLVRVEGNSTVYMAVNNELRPFHTSATFKARGLKFTNIQTISADELASSTVGRVVGYPDGTLIKGTKPTVYKVSGDAKVGIPSMAVLRKMRLSLKKVLKLSDAEVASYDDGGVAN